MRLNKRQKRVMLVAGIFAILGIALILFAKSPAFKVTLATKETHLEIGTKAKTDPYFYLDGNEWSIALSHVDTSSVKHTRVGRYPIYIYHGFQKLTSYVNVTDTTAPIVRSNIKNKTVVAGDIISTKTLDLDIKDYSEIESIQFTKISSTNFYTGLPDEQTADMREAYRKGLPMETEELQLSYGGIYVLTVSVRDAFHNTSEIEYALTVETPPVIEAANNFYVADTKEIDFKEYIEVWDLLSEDIQIDDVNVDTSKLKLSTPGTYPVIFSATDDYGLTAEKTIHVHVSSQEALQELINTHAISLSEDVIIGAKNPYDSGYYTSQDMEFIQNIMLPSIVYVKNDVLGTFGSGFIIEINDEFITIATNEHVVHSDLTVDISFFDGLGCNGAVVAADVKRDIAFIRIPIDGNSATSSISGDYVHKLRTVHIDKGYWDKLADDCRIKIGYNCINNAGQIWKTDSGYIVEKEAIRNWNQHKNLNETIISMEPVAGSSGSALFDESGRLVGMMRGYTDYGSYSETIAVPLSEILSYFEVIFKYKIHYQ